MEGEGPRNAPSPAAGAVMPAAHAREHSLEVELPFLQRTFPQAKLVALAVGRATPEEVAEVLDATWEARETAIVISSDLSHYLPL